ncbi:ATP-binding cassette domain-containing protein, partial [Pseudoflavonifractor phocaeensis]|uniref:ATP-binding cassette domain-containing protein n=1 Tax=Pseudoflavonifractor phocaeensis TaxID=1870988 RepID=UPI001959FEA6
DIREMSVEALNDQISYVAQEQFLFNMSLLENIRLGRPEATDQEVLAAAEKAQCGEFLARLEHGIHTMAGDGGKMLSGGERQRISIARCILKDAPIVILDEATASVDADNESYIQQAISELVQGKTLLVIAHRLNTIRGADQILVISDGEIAQRGTHQSLMEEGGIYRNFVTVRQQSRGWNRKAGA